MAGNGSKLMRGASVLGKWYSINGELASSEDAEVMAARGLPFGDYWVARDFVRKLQTDSEIKPRQRIHLRAIH